MLQVAQRLVAGRSISVEINEVCAKIFPGKYTNGSNSAGLKHFAKSVLQLEVSKPKKVTMSKWDRFPLTLPQIKYASQDAWLGAALLNALISHGYDMYRQDCFHGDANFTDDLHKCIHRETIADEIEAREAARAERRRQKRRQKRIEKQAKEI